MVKQVHLLLLMILMYSSAFTQNYNRPVPATFPPYEFELIESVPGTYQATSPFKWGVINPTNYMGLLDENGYLVWWTGAPNPQNDLKYDHFHGHFTFIDVSPSLGVQFKTLSSDMVLLDSVSSQLDEVEDNHEFVVAENGNQLFLSRSDTVMDLSQYMFNDLQGVEFTSLRSINVQEIDPLGNVVFHWRASDHIHPDQFIDGFYYNQFDFDFVHANSINEDWDGNLLVSFRHLDAVYKIHRTTGEVIWKLGGKQSDFSFPNDSVGFSGQHAARRTVNGTIGMFDNSCIKPEPKSRAIEYALDTVNWTATKVFEHFPEDSLFSWATGSYQLDDPELRSIGWGSGFGPAPNATILNGDGEVISRLTYSDSIVSYRTWVGELPFEFPRPEITCADSGVFMTLTAQSGFDHYLWSSGEFTQTITVADTGDYMVWVNYGIGALGSLPFHVSDLNSACDPMGINNYQNVRRSDLDGSYDLLGRPIPDLPRGNMNIDVQGRGLRVIRP